MSSIEHYVAMNIYLDVKNRTSKKKKKKVNWKVK